MNSGLLVVNPSKAIFKQVLQVLDSDQVTNMSFPDQDLLLAIFADRWVPLPYVYNALKTLRMSNVHGQIWRDEEVKNVHYILTPKPWDAGDEDFALDPTIQWWANVNKLRLRDEHSLALSERSLYQQRLVGIQDIVS